MKTKLATIKMDEVQTKIFIKKTKEYAEVYRNAPTQEEKSNNLSTCRIENDRVKTKEDIFALFLNLVKEDRLEPLSLPCNLARLKTIEMILIDG